MSAGIHNIYVEQGATYSRSFTWKISGNPVNLTGYSARLQVRRDRSTDPMIYLTSAAGGGITLNGATGRIDVLISATGTASLFAGRHRYDLELEDGSGFVTRLLKGTFIVSSEETIN